MDFLTGSISGKVYLYRRKPNGTFGLPEVLKQEVSGLIGTGGAPISLGPGSAVAMADWFGHGKLDLFVGTGEGYVYLLPNEGTRQKPVFRRSERLKADGKVIMADGGVAGPFVADWDQDGRLDLVVGCGSGRVVWYRNIGSNGQPQLAAGVTLVQPFPGGANASGSRTGAQLPTRSALNAKVCVADWNGDGRPDLIVGDYWLGNGVPHGWVWVYLRTPTQTAQLDKQ
jgi:hypothetical protein